MPRASAVCAIDARTAARVLDEVVLTADERHRRRVVLTGARGTSFLLDLPHATVLRHGDGLLLEDGSIVRVVGKPEPLLEISAASGAELARLAWHIGNRHTDVQIVGERLRIRRDHVLEEMLRGLGARLAPVEAPFEPESGAYHSHRHTHQDHDHHGQSSRAHPFVPAKAGTQDSGFPLARE
jgi:urease accessory protein